MGYWVYIIYSCSHGKYYVGQTSDLAERLVRHNRGSEKFTAPYRPWVLKCAIERIEKRSYGIRKEVEEHKQTEAAVVYWKIRLAGRDAA